MLRVFVGYDCRESQAYEVAARSLVHHASEKVDVTPLVQPAMRQRKLYWRSPIEPASTEFTFTRFLVPKLSRGWALFVDCDVMFRADVAELFALADPRFAVQVVKHNYRPAERIKMDRQLQTHYERKNWASVVLWNCAHPAHQALDLALLNSRPPLWLLQFQWLPDELIGELPERWNWLEGWSTSPDPALVHFTRGGPWFGQWQDVAYAQEWQAWAGATT